MTLFISSVSAATHVTHLARLALAGALLRSGKGGAQRVQSHEWVQDLTFKMMVNNISTDT